MFPPDSPHIQSEDNNKVYFWYAVQKIGRGLFIKIFKWLTAGLGDNIEIEILNFYNEKIKQNAYNEKYNCYFKSYTPQQWYDCDFLESERRVLNNTESRPEDFTLSLLGKLFKKVCPLLTKNGKLRDMIHEIVCLQNSFAREEFVILDDELPSKLSDIESKYLDMLTEVSTLCESILISIPDEKKEIKHQFTNLQTWLQEPVGVEDYEDFGNNINQLRKRLKQEVQRKCNQKLKIDYQERCQDEPSPFFEVTGINHHKFTECHFIEQDNIQIQKEKEYFHKRNQIKKQCNYTNLRTVKTLELLKFQLANDQMPPVILLHGDDYVGMSSLCQLYALFWAQGKDDIAGLAHHDMVLYHDCGTHQASSLDHLLSELLHYIMVDIGLEVCHLREILNQLHILLILDRYEEANNSTLFSDSIGIAGSMIRIVTTSSSVTAQNLEYFAIERRKCILDLSYQGMSIRNQERFVKRLLDVNITNEFEKNEIFESIVTNLSTLNDVMGECLRQSPHILSDLTQLWIEGENVSEMTRTQIFNKINESLQRKLVSNLLISGIGIDVAEKCKLFDKYLCEIAYFAAFSNENELEEGTVHILREKCKQLKLPQKQVFSHYLIFRRFRIENQSIDIHYEFPHNSLKESHASKHIVYLLQKPEMEFDWHEWHEKLRDTRYKNLLKLRDTRYKNLLRNITGNLTLLYPDQINKYGEWIIQLENQYNGNRNDNILCNVAESASNPECLAHMTEIVSELMSSCPHDKGDKVSKLTWTVRTNAALIPLIHVLKVKKPQILILENINFSAFKNFLPNVSQRRMDVNIYMDVGFKDDQLYDGYSATFHDEYLMHLTKSEHIFKVQWFTGWLTEFSISKLPQTLTRLKLNISTRNAPSLMEHVMQLQNLKVLEIYLFGSSEPKLTSFPLEFSKRSKLRQFTLCITGLSSEDIPWFTNLANICSPKTGALHTIKLHNTTATGKSICNMIEELQKTKTTYERFEFKCKTDISLEEKEMFDHLSKSSTCIRSIIVYHMVEGSLVTKYSWQPRENLLFRKVTIVPQKSNIEEDGTISEDKYEDVTNLREGKDYIEESSDDGVYYSSTSEMSDEEEDKILSGEIGLEAFMNKRKNRSTTEDEQPRKKIKLQNV